MIKRIQHFEEVGLRIFSKVLEKFAKEPEKRAEFVYKITESVVQLDLYLIAKTFKSMDDELKKSKFRT